MFAADDRLGMTLLSTLSFANSPANGDVKVYMCGNFYRSTLHTYSVDAYKIDVDVLIKSMWQ